MIIFSCLGDAQLLAMLERRRFRNFSCLYQSYMNDVDFGILLQRQVIFLACRKILGLG